MEKPKTVGVFQEGQLPHSEHAFFLVSFSTMSQTKKLTKFEGNNNNKNQQIWDGKLNREETKKNIYKALLSKWIKAILKALMN